MTLSPFVLFVLFACWAVSATITLVLYRKGYAEDHATAPERPYQIKTRESAIDLAHHVSTPLLAASSQSEQLRQLTREPASKTVLKAQYTECAVNVVDESGNLASRWCSLCMN